ncbi:hypothetical protein N4599_02530 [Limosilactobacillus oris]|uniref:hypothetical protein n=1 Tax=Limosilactobacillus oris TaxID=1632 RepID=UPI0021B4AD29|nr:hypothetical protein [Limosilactobacillus oris]UXC67840.1 hypothetical protein N4599_02530 [Limosilactobacillus oris]
MAVSYRDNTSFDDSDHTMKQIAEAIRHKMYGVDVREAIAQGFELMYKKIAELEGDDDGTDAKNELAQLEKRLNARIDRITMGTDDTAIRNVVEAILKEKGVI